MNKTYAIKGMHCQSCVRKLTESIERVDGVDSAEVTLDPPQAAVTGMRFASNDIEQAVRDAGDYWASTNAETTSVAQPPTSKILTYYPLILIVAFLLGGCAILQYRGGTWNWMGYMSDFMGGFFIVFGFFKLLDLRGFVDAYQSYDIIAAEIRGYGYAYPFIELAIGAAYLARIAPSWTNTITLIVMVIGSIGVLRSLMRKQTIQCACLGTVFELPMSTVTVVEDVGMAAMAAVHQLDVFLLT